MPAAPSSAADATAPSGRRLLFRWTLRCVLFLAFAYVALAGFDAVRLVLDLRAGQDRLKSFDLEQATAPGGIAAVTGDARTHLERAAHIAATSPWLGVLTHLPGLGPQIDEVRTLTSAAADVGDLADVAARRIDDGLTAAGKDPAARVTLLDTATSEIDRIDGAIGTLDLGSGHGLLPPLASARRTLQHRLAKAHTELADARRYTAALRRFIAGPSTGLLLAANNAEMSGGSGMLLMGGRVHVANGDIVVDPLTPTALYFLGDKGLTPPGDLNQLYGKMGLGVDFRGSSSDPNFPTIAPLIAGMAQRTAAYGGVGDVILVAAVALQQILSVTGPVTVDGVSYGADNVLQEVLNTNYLRYKRTSVEDNRYQLQGVIARAAFDALKTRNVPLAKVISRLRDAATGRHLLVWSSDPDLEAVWDTIGASGRVPADALRVSIQNYDGDKLDWYLRPQVNMVLRRDVDNSIVGGVTVTIRNDPRNPTSPEIEGLSPNEHFVFLGLHLPAGATDLESYDHPWDAVGNDPPSRVGIMIDYIPTGQQRTWRFSFRLPAGQSSLTLVPSGRVHPLDVTVNGFHTDDAIARPLGLPRPIAPPGPPPGLLLAGLAVALVGFGWALAAHRRAVQVRGVGVLAGVGDPASYEERAAVALLLVACALLALAAVT